MTLFGLEKAPWANAGTRHSVWWKIGAFLFALGGLATLVLAVRFVVRPASASGPSSNRVLNYQIRLTDPSGIPTADGTKNIKISFYDAVTGGTTLHTDCGTTGTPIGRKVVFTGGIGTVLIGDTAADASHNCTDGSAPNALPATLFNSVGLFLGLTVEADAEMAPRKRIVATGYSLNADMLDDLDTSAVGGTVAFVPVTDSSGNLTLTKDLTVDGTTLYVDSANDRIGIGTAVPSATLTAQGVNSSAVLGSDIITNGTFNADVANWTPGATWSWSDDDSLCPTAGVNGCAYHAAGDNNLTQTISGIVAEQAYQIIYTVRTLTTGRIHPVFGGAADGALYVGGTVGTITNFQVVLAPFSSGSVDLVFDPDATWSGSIDLVSVKPITASSPVVTLNNSDGTGNVELRAGGSGNDNTLIGRNAGFSMTTAANNTAIGVNSLFSATTGNSNTAIGYYSMKSNTTGGSNTAIGISSLSKNTSGLRNVALGDSALLDNRSGSDNASTGRWSMLFNASGSQNAAHGARALFSNTTGGDNTGIGYNAGNANVSGTFNTFIGSNANSTTGVLTNATAIGANSVVGASNSLVLGGTGANAVSVGIGTTTPGERLEVVGNVISKGTAWTSRASAANNTWLGVTYGNGLFVAVASDGVGNRVMTSPDGINWTTRTSAADNQWMSVTYGNGLFVAISQSGTGNRVMTSPDGITWTTRTSAADNQWKSVTYGNGIFVAVASNGTNRVMTSPDGITWTSQSAAAANLWAAVTYGNGTFVATSETGIGNRVMTSPDGITWTSRTSAADNAWISVTYGNGLFVAVSPDGTGNRVMTSPDGINWTTRTSAANNSWYAVTYGGGLFVATAISGTGNRVMTSPDGITWTIRTSAADNGWQAVTYGNGTFVAVSTSGTSNRVMTSGKTELNPLAHNNTYQGGMNIFGDVGIGTTAPAGKLDIQTGTITTDTAFGLNVGGTLDASASGGVTLKPVKFEFSTSGAGTNRPEGMRVTLNAGYTGSGFTKSLFVQNVTASTDPFNSGTFSGNIGALITSTGTGVDNVGVYSQVSGATSRNLGYYSRVSAATAGSNIGYFGIAANATTNNIGGYFALTGTSAGSLNTSAALIADNGTTVSPIFLARDNGIAVLTVADGGTTTLAGHFLPDVDDTFDLGSDTKRWRDLYLGPATLHVGTSTSDEGTLSYNTTTNTLQIDTPAGGSIEIAGGSGSSGCSVDASGNFTCSGTVAGAGGGPGWTDDGTAVRLTTVTDNVGIGTASPITQLHVPGKVPVSAIGSAATGTNPQNVFVQGRYAYVVNRGANTLQVFDVSDPAAPAAVGSVATKSKPWGLHVQGRYAYVSNYAFGGTDKSHLQIFDISNPAAPVSVGAVITGVDALSLYVQGRYAYVGNYTSGNRIEIYDVSNPTAPFKVGDGVTTEPGLGTVIALYAKERYLYTVHELGQKFSVYDVSNPAVPVKVATIAFPAGTNPQGVTVQGRYAYAIGDNATLHVIDVSNPAAPVFVGTPFAIGAISSPGSGHLVQAQGRYVYIANYGASTMQVIDVSDPAVPVSVGTVATGAGPTAVAVQGRHAFVTNYTANTFQVFDVGGSYIQQLEAGGIESGTLSLRSGLKAVDGGFSGGLNIGQSLNVAGNASFAADTYTGGTLTVGDGNVLLSQGSLTTPFGGIGRYENRLTYSEQFDNAIWVKTGVTVTANSTASPDGTTTADTIDDGVTVNGDIAQNDIAATAGETFTFSVWFKNDNTDRNVQIKIQDNGSVPASSQVYANPSSTWRRYSVTHTASAGTTNVDVSVIDNDFNVGSEASNRFYVWGAQLEKQSNAGVYIRTEGSAVTTTGRGLVMNGSGPHLFQSGNVGIGTADPANFKLQVAGNVGPEADNTYDLGSASLRWKTLHVGPGSVVVHNDATDTAKMTLGFTGSTATITSNSGTPIDIRTGTTTAMAVASNGDVTFNGNVTTTKPITTTLSGHALGASTRGLWKLDESSGTATAADATGTYPLATIVGTPGVTTGKFGNARTFNGSSDVRGAADAGTVTQVKTGAWSIGMWFISTNSATGLGKNLFAVMDAGNNAPFHVKVAFNSIYAGSTDQGNSTAGGTINDGVWYHLVLTHAAAGSGFDVYLNGAFVGHINVNNSALTPASPLIVIGGGPHDQFEGTIDDVFFENAAMTAGEVLADYNKASASALSVSGKATITGDLDLTGALTVSEMSAPSLSPTDKGRIYFDATANKFRVSENGGAYADLVSSGGFVNGGNSFGAAATLGTNDNFALNFEANNSTKLTVLPSGNVGVGDTTPDALFSVGTTSQYQINGSGNVTTAGTLHTFSAAGTVRASGGSDLTLDGSSLGRIILSGGDQAGAAASNSSVLVNPSGTGDTTGATFGVNGRGGNGSRGIDLSWQDSTTSTGGFSALKINTGALSGATGVKRFLDLRVNGRVGFDITTGNDSTTGSTMSFGNSPFSTAGYSSAIVGMSPSSGNPGAYAGGSLTIAGGNAFQNTSGNANGGALILDSGTPVGTGTGTVTIGGTTANIVNIGRSGQIVSLNGNVGVGTSSPITQLHVPGLVPTAQVGAVSTTNGAYTVFVQGKYAYVTNFNGDTLQVIDVSVPSSPAVVGTVATGSGPNSVNVLGKYAYLVNSSSNSLQVFDVSVPNAPVLVSTLAVGSNPLSLSVQGKYAYVGNYFGNTLQVVDISDPATPVSVTTVAVTAPISMKAQGRYVYVASYGGGSIVIVDVGNPSSPVVAGSVSVSGSPRSIYVQGRYAYLAVETANTMKVVDVSTPASPVVVGTVATGAGPRAVFAQGRYAFIFNHDASTVQAFDVSAPASPVSVGTVSAASNSLSIYVQGRYLYAALIGSSQLQIFDFGGAYVQGLEAGGIETGALTVSNGLYANDGAFGGNLSVAQNAEFSGRLGVLGESAFIGNVGIGMTAPSTKLFVTASSATVASFNRTTDDGTIISLLQAGAEEGSISVSGTTISYNAFTGSHYAWTDEQIEQGMLVRYTGENRRLHGNEDSEMLYGITPTSEKNDPAVLGVYLALKEPSRPANDENPHLVMAVGNGDLWVVDDEEDIEPGDYLISSDTPGHAMKDESTETVSHLIARAAEPVDWSHVTETVDGKKHKRISVTFVNFTRYSQEQTSELTVTETLDYKGYGIENVAFLRGMNGNWSIDEAGLLTSKAVVTEKVTTQNLTIKNEGESVTAGTGTIRAGAMGELVINPLVNDRSIIVVTLEGDTGARWWISEKENGKFMINLSSPALAETKFSYWIVGLEGGAPPAEQPAPAPEEAPAEEVPPQEEPPLEPPTPAPEEAPAEEAPPQEPTEPPPTEPEPEIPQE